MHLLRLVLSPGNKPHICATFDPVMLSNLPNTLERGAIITTLR